MKWLKNTAKRVNWKECGIGGALLALGVTLIVTCVAPNAKDDIVEDDVADDSLTDDFAIDDSDFEL